MTIEAQLADGRILEFPDGTSPEVMQAAVKRILSQGVPGQAEEVTIPAGPITTAQQLPTQRERQQPITGMKPVGLGEILEPAVTLATGAIAEPFAGLAGIAALPFGAETAAETVQAVKKAITVPPLSPAGERGIQAVGEALKTPIEAFKAAESTLGEATLEATGSPELAAIAHTLPTAALEALGIGVGRVGRAVTERGTARSQAAVDAITDAKAGRITEEGTQNVVDTIQRGTPDEVAQVIDADPDFFRAADELGVNTEPLAGFASQNPQFRDVEAALRKVPGSVLEPQAIRFIEETSQAADNLIQRYGGTLDKAQLGLDFKRESLATIDNLADQTDNVYGTLRDLIPEVNRFEAPSTVEFLADLAAKEKIPPKMQRILNDLTPRTVKGKRVVSPATGFVTETGRTLPPTLGKIDQIRREVGQAINKGSGPFKDVESGLNKALYARLTKDQDAIAASVPDGLNISESAKGLVRQRKHIEDNLVTLLGKDLNKALNVNVAGAIKNLQKGEIGRFNEVMNAIPKHKRGEVALSAMNDVFKGSGVGQQSLSPTQFTKWYQTINRSPATKAALFSVLPKGSQRAIDNLFQVSRGISRSLGQTTPTGRINALFNPETGIIRRMIGKTATSAAAIATGSPAASAATSVTMDFLRQTTDGAKRAAELMGSPQFQNIVRQSVKEGVIDGGQASAKLLKAEQALTRSKQYQSWANTLGTADRAALQGGLLSYLFRQEEQPQEQQ